MSDSPILRTARLVMDMHRPQDLDDCAAMDADAAIMRHITGRPSTRTESWARILRFSGSWSLLGFGYWAVREGSSGRFVGNVGFGDPRRDIVPPLDGIPEIGWVLASWAQGNGYATEAAAAAIRWADAVLPHPETVCLIDPDNTASLRVAAKVGYAETGRGRLEAAETIILRRQRRSSCGGSDRHPDPGRNPGRRRRLKALQPARNPRHEP